VTAGVRLRGLLVDLAPLRRPAYRRLWLSTAVTTVGTALTAVAVPKQIFDLTESSAYVGLSGAVALVPMIAFALWGGSIADAVDRRKMLLATNAGIAATSLALFAQAALGNQSVWLVLALLGCQQALFGLNSPARGAVIPQLVPAAELPAAMALGMTTTGIGAVIGPLLAGVLIPVLGLPRLYLIDALLLMAIGWAVWRLPPMPVDRTTGDPGSGLRSVIDGLRYLTSHPVLLVSYLADLIAMVFGMPRALFPELASRTFGLGGLGWLYAGIPIGAFVAGLLSGTFSKQRRQGLAVVLAISVWGLAVIGLGFAPTLPLAVICLAAAGAADMVSAVFRTAILATAATNEMQGRTQAVFFVVVAGGPRLADLLHGSLSSLLGPRITIVAGGVTVLVLIAALTVRFPAFVRYRLGDT
jgi:MFS family permease